MLGLQKFTITSDLWDAENQTQGLRYGRQALSQLRYIPATESIPHSPGGWVGAPNQSTDKPNVWPGPGSSFQDGTLSLHPLEGRNAVYSHKETEWAKERVIPYQSLFSEHLLHSWRKTPCDNRPQRLHLCTMWGFGFNMNLRGGTNIQTSNSHSRSFRSPIPHILYCCCGCW